MITLSPVKTFPERALSQQAESGQNKNTLVLHADICFRLLGDMSYDLLDKMHFVLSYKTFPLFSPGGVDTVNTDYFIDYYQFCPLSGCALFIFIRAYSCWHGDGETCDKELVMVLNMKVCSEWHTTIFTACGI